MEFQEVIRHRRMCRSFEDRPVPPALVERILGNGRRAPSAGFTQGWAFVVLEGAEQTAQFWEHATDPEWRAAPDWPGLLRAPVVILPLAHEASYRLRYAEADKDAGPPGKQSWPVPYWLVDTSFAVMAMLLSATDLGLGALFFGIEHHEAEVLAVLGVPAGHRALGAIALGWPAADDRPSGSVRRGWRPEKEVVHRGRWSPPGPAGSG